MFHQRLLSISTQGANNNTSYKCGKSLFVQDSGFKLKNELKEDIFVELYLNLILFNLNKRKSDEIDYSWDKRKSIYSLIKNKIYAVLFQKYIFFIEYLISLNYLVKNDLINWYKKLYKFRLNNN